MTLKWQCDDIGTAVYQGYASPAEKAELERICGEAVTTGGLPYTGFSLGIIIVLAVALILAGLLLARSGRTS